MPASTHRLDRTAVRQAALRTAALRLSGRASRACHEAPLARSSAIPRSVLLLLGQPYLSLTADRCTGQQRQHARDLARVNGPWPMRNYSTSTRRESHSTSERRSASGARARGTCPMWRQRRPEDSQTVNSPARRGELRVAGTQRWPRSAVTRTSRNGLDDRTARPNMGLNITVEDASGTRATVGATMVSRAA